MFTWICPKCGTEVPPAYTECPNCVLKDIPQEPLKAPSLRGGPAAGQQPPAPAAAPAAPPPTAAAPPAAPAPYAPAAPSEQAAPVEPVYSPPAPPAPPVAPAAYVPPAPTPGYAPPPPPVSFAPPPPAPPAAPPPAPGYYPPPGAPAAQPGVSLGYYGQPPRQGMPSWLYGLLFGLLFVAILGGGYWFYQNREKVKEGGVKLEPAPAGSAQNELEKVLEVTGLRIMENDKKQTQLVFLVVNHSRADLKDVEANVYLRRSTDAPEADPFARLNLKVSLGPYQSKEFNTPLQTSLRAYELPDWQFLRAEVRVTRP